MRPHPGGRSRSVASLVALVALVTLAALAVTAAAQPRPAHVTARDRWMTAVTPACASIAWAVAGALTHVRKPPWKPREDVELSVACGQRDGRPMLAVRRRAIDARRVEITVDVGPPMIAPIDPSKP